MSDATSEFSIDVADWLGTLSDPDEATFGSLVVRAEGFRSRRFTTLSHEAPGRTSAFQRSVSHAGS